MTKLKLTYEFENEGELRAHLLGRDEEVQAVGAAPTETIDEQTGEVKTVDSDGFPFDPELHTEGRTVNADGRWKAKRGKSEAEVKARAAFKAAGATMTEVVATPAALPVEAAMPAMPGLPAAAEARAPIALDALIQRIQAGMASQKIGAPGQTLGDLYAKAGNTDPNSYATNETLRGALWDVLDQIGVA